MAFFFSSGEAPLPTQTNMALPVSRIKTSFGSRELRETVPSDTRENSSFPPSSLRRKRDLVKVAESLSCAELYNKYNMLV